LSDDAPNWATPVALSQKMNELGLLLCRLFSASSAVGNTGTLFTICLPFALPELGRAKC